MTVAQDHVHCFVGANGSRSLGPNAAGVKCSSKALLSMKEISSFH